MLLSKEQILSKTDLKTKDVDVPEWGGTVRVSQISAIDRNNLQATLVDPVKGKVIAENLPAFMIRAVAFCIVDEQGSRLFTDEDVEALGKKSADAIDRVFKVCDELNGISPKGAEELKKT